jgi:hypothetical protein
MPPWLLPEPVLVLPDALLPVELEPADAPNALPDNGAEPEPVAVP